jgi:hypothetical protein
MVERRTLVRTLGIETPRTVEHTGTRYVRTGTHQKTELAENKNSVSKTRRVKIWRVKNLTPQVLRQFRHIRYVRTLEKTEKRTSCSSTIQPISTAT